jgi:hypothetical protein
VIDEDGVVQEAVYYSYPGGEMEIDIAGGTVVETEDGQTLQAIEVTRVCTNLPPPPANAYLVGCAYDFGPEGVTFDPPITITLRYEPSLVPDEVAEEDLVIAYYDSAKGEWVVLPSTVDIVNHTISAEASHFTMFAAYAFTGAPGPATPTPAPAPGDGESNVWVIVGPILAVVALAALIYFVFKRRGGAEDEGETGEESQAQQGH